MRPDDTEAIVALHATVYTAEHGFDASFAPYVATPLAVFAKSAGVDGKIWIAERSNGQVVGSVAILRIERHAAQLRWFIVAHDSRGFGLGHRLCDAAMAWVLAEKFETVTLWTFAGLDAAMALYKARGFEIVETRKGTLGGKTVEEIRMDWKTDTG